MAAAEVPPPNGKVFVYGGTKVARALDEVTEDMSPYQVSGSQRASRRSTHKGSETAAGRSQVLYPHGLLGGPRALPTEVPPAPRVVRPPGEVPSQAGLDQLATRTGLPLVARFAQGISVGVERSAPLADVLHAQAADVREAGRRELSEIAARK